MTATSTRRRPLLREPVRWRRLGYTPILNPIEGPFQLNNGTYYPPGVRVIPVTPGPGHRQFPGLPLPLPTPIFFPPEPPISIPSATPSPYTPIPSNGPLPPGAGYQQVEAPGNPYPYVYIGPGSPPAPPPVQMYPIGAATNVPLPDGSVLNPAAAEPSSSGFSISNFVSQYGLYIGLGIVGVVLLKSMGGRR